MTTVMSSPLAGAEMMTFLAPAARWPLAFSASVKSPVDSMTYSTPSSFHGSSAGVFADDQALDLVAVDDEHVVLGLVGRDFFAGTVPSNRPWVESYLSR